MNLPNYNLYNFVVLFFWTHISLGVTPADVDEKITDLDEEECEEEEEEEKEKDAVEYSLPVGVSKTGSCRT